MAFAYGQNMADLGRNVIDLEHLKNIKDAQQAQAQNDFLQHINQAALGRQQLAAQSQAQQNAMMMQALQQGAQDIQQRQFADQLALSREQLNKVDPRLEQERRARNAAIDQANSRAVSVATQLNSELQLEKDRYGAEIKEINRGVNYWGRNKAKELNAAFQKHNAASAAIRSKAGQDFGSLSIEPDESDPSELIFKPKLLPRTNPDGTPEAIASTLPQARASPPIPQPSAVDQASSPLPSASQIGFNSFGSTGNTVAGFGGDPVSLPQNESAPSRQATSYLHPLANLTIPGAIASFLNRRFSTAPAVSPIPQPVAVAENPEPLPFGQNWANAVTNSFNRPSVTLRDPVPNPSPSYDLSPVQAPRKYLSLPPLEITGDFGAPNGIPYPQSSPLPDLSSIISSGRVPMVSAQGGVRFPKQSDVQDWIANGWKVHPAVQGAPTFPQAPVNPFSGTSPNMTPSYFSPIPWN